LIEPGGRRTRAADQAARREAGRSRGEADGSEGSEYMKGGRGRGCAVLVVGSSAVRLGYFLALMFVYMATFVVGSSAVRLGYCLALMFVYMATWKVSYGIIVFEF
jgi:hypothetical protein